ncbi:MAG: hypothetical protein H6559_05455 [Lewinellaceae bacterium]|nr:hypothetical protein [Lewinellaceae bacterium]
MSSNKEMEIGLREILISKGYEIFGNIKENGETGCDLIAEKDRNTYHIEVIGYKRTGPARSKDFFQVFFRAVSRLDDNAKNCVIALPCNFLRGIKQRTNNYKVAWDRIGKIFPELVFWFVDLENRKITPIHWKDLPGFLSRNGCKRSI